MTPEMWLDLEPIPQKTSKVAETIKIQQKSAKIIENHLSHVWDHASVWPVMLPVWNQAPNFSENDKHRKS